LIKRFAYKLFPNNKVKGCYQLRITRNSDLFVDPEAVEDLLQALAGELPSRRYGEAVRLEVSSACPTKVTHFLLERFELTPSFLYQNDGPVNLNRLLQLPDLINRADLKYAQFKPSIPKNLLEKKSIFELVRKEDVLLHHPYESFLPVIDLLAQAAQDPEVLVIKQTLYRTGEDSIILDHLMNAARAGKEVIVVIELMARFDEETNISTATKLQQAGVHVVFGKVGRKTHAKMMMIVRRENDVLKRYCHLGTGNYHQSNTAIYTDYGFMTSDKNITEDVHKIFMQLTTYGENQELNSLVQSPYGIRNMVIKNIEHEIEHANNGKPARIIAKMNGLISPMIIEALYKASQAGVKIDLVVRGICCLRPQVEGISDNIRVHSILGRFLEHGRIYWFHNNGKDKVYCASADWMPRNLTQRIEQAVMIKNTDMKQRLINDLTLYVNDNQQRWELNATGEYDRIRHEEGQEIIDAQATLLASLKNVQ
jgi:polyphosphate kinase